MTEILIWRVICPTCKTIMFQGNPGDNCIIECQTCGDVFRLSPYFGSMPLKIGGWSKDIEVLE